MSDKIAVFNHTIARLSENEQDPIVKHFFTNLNELKNEPVFNKIVEDIVESRPDISEEHLSYLIYVSLQYLTDFSYDIKRSADKLKSDLEQFSQEIIRICKERNVSTNVIERYCHLNIILEIIDSQVRLADLGSGLGLGLMSLNTKRFTSISVHPRLDRYTTQSAQISEAYGVDIQSPDISWTKACYLPENKEYRANIGNRREATENDLNFEFVRGDILELETLDIPEFDVVWTSNVLYQIEAPRNEIESSIRSVLKSGGMWINADYKYKDDDFTQDNNPYLSQVRIMPDWDNKLEVLKSPSDNVESIRPGNDFDQFESRFQR